MRLSGRVNLRQHCEVCFICALVHRVAIEGNHKIHVARRIGQRVLMLHDKKIYASGPADEFFASQDPVVRQFIDGVADPKEHMP